MNQIRKNLLERIGISIPENQILPEDWFDISKEKVLSEEFIREFKENLDWQNISKYQKLSSEFITEFAGRVYWSSISRHQEMSEEFIRKNKNNVWWEFISQNRILSEDFIREFQDKLDWFFVSCKNLFTDDFVHEFKDLIEFENQFKFRKANYLIIKRYITKTDFRNINEFKTVHLNNIQKQEIQKILDFKYTFKKQKTS